MATTYRNLINRVLRILREDEVPSSATELTTAYHKLIGAFVNQIKEEVEDAHNWRRLRHTETIAFTANNDSQPITNTTGRSRLVREMNEHALRLRPLVVDITDTDAPFEIEEWDLSTLLLKRKLETTSTSTFPTAFALDDSSADDEINLELYPASTLARNISISMITPQARLADTDVDTNITVPVRPVELGVLWYAMEERGEELGPNGTFTEAKYRGALDDAIARDVAEQGGLQLVVV